MRWARLLIHAGPPTPQGQQTLLVGTVGLHAFGLPEIEYAPTTQPANEALGHAASVSGYLLQPGIEVKDCETIGTPDLGGVWRFSSEPHGNFHTQPIWLLTRVA